MLLITTFKNIINYNSNNYFFLHHSISRAKKYDVNHRFKIENMNFNTLGRLSLPNNSIIPHLKSFFFKKNEK